MRLPPARATFGLVGVTCAAWLLVRLSGLFGGIVNAAGFVPGRLAGVIDLPGALPAWLTPLTATLLHADIMHLGFNMLMLGFCGRFVEAALGPRGLIILYVVGAFAAALAQFAAGPASAVPMIGASGAISAILGAYALLYGRQKRASANPRLNAAIQILWLAAAWVGLQLLVGFAFAAEGMAIAIAAHIGGFLAGLVLAQPLLRWRYRNA